MILPYPHQGQQLVRKQTKRFNWLAAGRRWRKTTLFMSLAVEKALAGKQVVWGAPTFEQVRISWDETVKAAYKVANFNQQRMIANFVTGGKITYRSLDDPDNSRGFTADDVFIDEVGDVKEVAWVEVLRPMLMDTGGGLWAGGTPKGRNWFWREHVNASSRDDSIAWQVPTLGCEIGDYKLIRKPHLFENPNIPFSEIEHLYKTLPERVFRQEILAEFIEDSDVFRRIKEAATAKLQNEPLNGHQYVIGVDWGKLNDFTVIAIVDIQEQSLVHLERFNQIDYTLQMGRLRALYDRFEPITLIAESNAMGEPIIEQLRRQNIPVQPFVTTNASKTQIIEELSLAFERSTIKILNDPVLIAELQAYETERLPSGLLRYSAPEGMHDDTVIALAIAWHAAQMRSGIHV